MVGNCSPKKLCVSIVDPARPTWFVRHYGFFLHIENESGHRNPHIFDDDSSFFLVPDQFYPGYYALQSINIPTHYILVTGDGRTKIVERQRGQNYQDTASFVLTDHAVGRKELVESSVYRRAK